jgi:sporulation protein YlmC with PRC-barrel domain
MKKSTIISMVVGLALLVASGAALGMSHEKGEGMGATTGSQQSQMVQQSDLAPIDQLSSFQVQSMQGENLGQVQDVIVDLNEGRIGYVVIGSGELAQTDAEKYIVPWKALQPSLEQNALTLTVDKAQLMSAPEGDIQQALTRQEGQEIHQFYGVAPYWEESATEGMTEPSGQQQELQQQEIQRQERLQQERQQMPR